MDMETPAWAPTEATVDTADTVDTEDTVMAGAYGLISIPTQKGSIPLPTKSTKTLSLVVVD
jgi:hypothetical protein